MKIAYRAFITILIAFAFSMTVIGFVKHIPLVFFLSLVCIVAALVYYIYKGVFYQARFENEARERSILIDINGHNYDKIEELKKKLRSYEEDK